MPVRRALPMAHRSRETAMKCSRLKEFFLLLAIAAVGILVATCQIHCEGGKHDQGAGDSQDVGQPGRPQW
jgi:hypothetical protein